MRRLLLIAGMYCIAVPAQDPNGLLTARQLANARTRQDAVARIVASGNDAVRLLLSLSQTPPPQVNEYELFLGLADAFGQLKTEEAIPFLIKHIGLERGFPAPNSWMKTAEVIEQRMPAVAALIQIGPAASKALMGAWQQVQAEDRLAAIFVVSRIKGVLEARAFLSSVVGGANLERFWAEEGLKALDPGR